MLDRRVVAVGFYKLVLSLLVEHLRYRVSFIETLLGVVVIVVVIKYTAKIARGMIFPYYFFFLKIHYFYILRDVLVNFVREDLVFIEVIFLMEHVYTNLKGVRNLHRNVPIISLIYNEP